MIAGLCKVSCFKQQNSIKSTQRGKSHVVQSEVDNKLLKSKSRETSLFIASEQSLSYLDGTLPGDFGFDPLGVFDPEGKAFALSPSWLRYSEVIHARWAMLGAAGCVAPDILGRAGIIPGETAVSWFKSGVIPVVGDYGHYWTDPYTLFFVEVVLMQFAELKRWQDYRNPGSQGCSYFLGLEKVLGGSGDPSC